MSSSQNWIGDGVNSLSMNGLGHWSFSGTFFGQKCVSPGMHSLLVLWESGSGSVRGGVSISGRGVSLDTFTVKVTDPETLSLGILLYSSNVCVLEHEARRYGVSQLAYNSHVS